MNQRPIGPKKLNKIPAQISSSQRLKKVETQDPSLEGGFNLLYEKTFDFYVEIQDSLENRMTENLRVRIFDQYQDGLLENMKIELTSDKDIYFIYEHIVNEEIFEASKDKNELHISFQDYPLTCKQIFDRLQLKDSYVVFLVQEDGSAIVTLYEPSDFNIKELHQMEFNVASEETIKMIITYKVMSLKHRLQLCEGRLKDVQNIIQVRAPSIFQEANYKINNRKL